jgi:SAM-dependent methyltransferase
VHPSSQAKMQRFVVDYLDPSRPCRIIDLGSMDVYGSYRHLFAAPGWTYLGVDVAPGENVDMVLADPYRWAEFADASIDVVVSGQALEHIEFFWLTFQEIARVLAPGGLACVIAPSRGPEHRYPLDCWRFYPDAFRALARWSGLALVSVSTDWGSEDLDADSALWGDTCAVLRKEP